MLNLDTHILVYLLKGELLPEERELLESHDWAVADVVLWELAKLRQLERLEIDLEGAAFRRCLRALTIIPVTTEIALESTRLDFKADPADHLIAATSIVERIPLLTRDRIIRSSQLVPLAGPPQSP